MAVIAGIDEAGFGPVLGPLVVSAAAIEVPDELADVPMWKLLAGAVVRRPSRRPQALAIGDSKKLYNRQRPNALAHLERGVLAMLATRSRHPASLAGLLKVVAPSAVGQLGQYPWYRDADLPLPRCIGATDAALAGNALGAALAKAGMRLLAMRSEVVFAGEYNRTVRATDNKSRTLLDVTSRLLAYLWQKLPAGRVTIHADRQGGRMRYLDHLQLVFAGCDFKVLDETQTLSAYHIADATRAVDLQFGVDFDQHHMPVALASMLSKYLRELFMELLNRFWAARAAGLVPTAGYYTDGLRFLQDIAPLLRDGDIDEDLLRRCR